MISAYNDSYEGELAVLLLGESQKKVNFPREFLPDDVDEGDYITLDIALDEEANKKAEEEALELLRD